MFVPAALILASCLGVSAANAQNSACPYTNASLQGTYALLGTYGSNVALALGIRTYDGNGNLTGTAVLNEPTTGSTTGARTILTVTNVGTYTVNCNGTGKINRTATASNGVVVPAIDDFVITSAVRSQGGEGNLLIATAIADAQEIPSGIVAGGLFLTRVHTRLPDALTNWK